MMSPNLLLSLFSTVCLSSSLNNRTPSSSAPPVLSNDLTSIVMHGITWGNFGWKSLEILHNIYLWNTGTWMTELESDLVEYLIIFSISILFHIHSYCKVDYCFWTDPDFKSRRHNTFCLLFRELSIYRLLIQEARNDSRENCLDIKFLLSGLWFPYSSKNCQ